MKKYLKNTLLVVGMSLAAAALISRWPEVQPRLVGANWWLLALTGLGLLAYQFINAGVWSQVLGALGHRASFRQTAKVWLQSEALRWIPGGIWGYGSRIVNAQELGVAKGKASASLILEIALTNVAWAATASLLLFTPILSQLAGQVAQWLPSSDSPLLLIGLLPPLIGLGAVLVRKVPLLNRMAGRLRKLLPWRELQPARTLRTVLSYFGLCLFNGLLLWMVTLAVPGLDVPLVAAIGIAGGAWLAGFWAIGVPGGIGVREAALAGMLSLYGSLDSGIAVAVLWRSMQVAIELISLLLVTHPLVSSSEAVSSAPSGPRRFRNFRFLNLL